jgi:hypothetical protein
MHKVLADAGIKAGWVGPFPDAVEDITEAYVFGSFKGQPRLKWAEDQAPVDFTAIEAAVQAYVDAEAAAAPARAEKIRKQEIRDERNLRLFQLIDADDSFEFQLMQGLIQTRKEYNKIRTALQALIDHVAPDPAITIEAEDMSKIQPLLDMANAIKKIRKNARNAIQDGSTQVGDIDWDAEV